MAGAAVVVDAEEWERKTRRSGTLADFFAASSDGSVSFLLDTNVVSECTKPRPNPGVIEWLSQVDEDAVFLSNPYVGDTE
jgi:hypothetical protein